MDWNACFTRTARSARRSAVRELLRVANQPGVISFAGGLPAEELFPVEAVREACARMLAEGGARALQYGESEGLPELRAWIAARESRHGAKVDPEQVLITQGAQQALDLAGRCFLEPGRVAAVENPTYLALLSAWRAHGAALVPFAPSALARSGTWAGGGNSGTRGGVPTCLYAQPNFQNPTGTTWGLSDRWGVLEACRRDGVIVVEDDPYGELGFEGDAPPSLFALDAAGAGAAGGQVVRIGSFSKVLAPGLRLGWVVAPRAVTERLVAVRQAMDLQAGSLAQAVALELVRGGTLDRQIPRLRRAYAERCRVMSEALASANLRGTTWTRPAGGMFLWVGLPEGEDAEKLLERALAAGVAFVPGVEFHLAGEGANTLRLNYSKGSPERIREGVRRLAQEIQADSLTLSAAGA